MGFQDFNRSTPPTLTRRDDLLVRTLAILVIGLALLLIATRARAQDAFDLSQARLASRDSIDVRNWPVVVNLQSVTLGGSFERGDVKVDFPGKFQLPSVINMEGGAITYTLWLGFHVGDAWYVFGAVNCINDYVPTDAMLRPGQMANMTYYLDAPALNYQPQPGERIAMFVTTGVTRRDNRQASGSQFGRSKVVIVPFAAGTYDVASVQPTTTPTSTPTQTSTGSSDAMVAWAIEFQNWSRLNANTQNAQIDALRTLAEQVLAAQERQFQNLSAQLQQLKVPTQQSAIDPNDVNWTAFMKWLMRVGIPGAIGLIGGLAAK